MSTFEQFEQSGNSWIPKVYECEGTWTIESDAEGLTFNLADNFFTNRGPDLKVYIATRTMSSIGDREAVDLESDFVAELASNSGAQSYRLPTRNFADYQSVLIHCREFTVVWCGVDINQ